MSVNAEHPKISYWHLWTDDDGVSHQIRCELTSFEMGSVGGKAAPQWNDSLFTGDANIVFCVLPVGWIGDWHENPKPQWISVLSGHWFVESMDGMRVEMGPGDLAFGGDQNTTPDKEGRAGHRSGTIGTEPCALMTVRLDEAAWVGARPGAFK
jgi:hypothetical protein